MPEEAVGSSPGGTETGGECAAHRPRRPCQRPNLDPARRGRGQVRHVRVRVSDEVVTMLASMADEAVATCSSIADEAVAGGRGCGQGRVHGERGRGQLRVHCRRGCARPSKKHCPRLCCGGLGGSPLGRRSGTSLWRGRSAPTRRSLGAAAGSPPRLPAPRCGRDRVAGRRRPCRACRGGCAAAPGAPSRTSRADGRGSAAVASRRCDGRVYVTVLLARSW